MDRIIDIVSAVMVAIMDFVRAIASVGISAVETPAHWIGLRPEILAAALFCAMLLALWRSVGGSRR